MSPSVPGKKYGNYETTEDAEGVHVVPQGSGNRESGGTKKAVDDFIQSNNSGSSTFDRLKEMVRQDGNLAEED